MPGLTADDLALNVQQRTVTIQGEPKAEQSDGWRPRKVYQVMPSKSPSEYGYLRVIDESGEDYLYPANGPSAHAGLLPPEALSACGP